MLTPGQVAATTAHIASLQEPDGAIPWSPSQQTDVWNHVESAMGLVVGGEVGAAERAWDWCAATQRADGSWPLRTVLGVVEDASGDTNQAAYVAVGLWHHWLVRRDDAFVARHWPMVRRALDWVVGLQRPWGGVGWSQEWDEHGPARVNEGALLTGSSSIFLSLRAGAALADLLGDPQPDWELAAESLGRALRTERARFVDKREFSMDWYYPVLGGAVHGAEAEALLAERWETFVVPGLGVRCVTPNPWVTGAESCELVLALDVVGDRDRAAALFADMQHLRTDDGGYWTGYVFDDDAVWPREQTSWTAAAVLLAHDALTGLTPGGGLFRDLARGVLPDRVP